MITDLDIVEGAYEHWCKLHDQDEKPTRKELREHLLRFFLVPSFQGYDAGAAARRLVRECYVPVVEGELSFQNLRSRNGSRC